MARPDEGDELWLAVPPGWIELVAHNDDAEASAWFERLLDQTPALFDDDGRAILRQAYDEVRRQMPQGLIDAAGVLITSLDDDADANAATLWQFSVAVVPAPPSGDVNLMAVVERFLDSPQGRRPLTDEDDLVESFRTEDGRDGVAIHTTTRVDDGGRLAGNVPGTDPARLGVVYAAVRLNRPRAATADRIAVVTGVAPNVEQRLAMSLVAAGLTLSAQLRDHDDAPPPGRVHLDATGRGRGLSDRSTTP